MPRAAALGVLEPRGQGRVGGEREGGGADGGGVRGEEIGEELEVCRSRDNSKAEAARRQEGDEVEERQRVALRREGDDKHVRRRLGGRGRLHGWGLGPVWQSGGCRVERPERRPVSFSPPVETVVFYVNSRQRAQNQTTRTHTATCMSGNR